MITAREIADLFESIAPCRLGNPEDELGFVFGDPGRVIRGVACMWNAHTASITRAIDAGCDMLIVHESLWFQPQASNWYDGPGTVEEIEPNRRRRELFERHGITVYRSHSNWDALPDDGVPDQAVAALQLTDLKVTATAKYFKVHQLPAPTSVSALAERARLGLNLPWHPRIFGGRDTLVERFAFLIGGFGGNQYNMPHTLHAMGAQCLIIGEMLEWFVIQSLEYGMPVIETLHSLSEIPAIKRQAQLLAARLPVPVHYIDSGSLAFTTGR